MPITSLPGANPYLFEHKIGVFELFSPSGPPFSGFSSTKSRFLCFFALRNPHFQAFRAQNRGFCAQEEGKVGLESVTAETLTTLPPHLRRSTSAPAHQHQRTRLATAPSNRTRRRQVLSRRLLTPSGTVLAPCSAVRAPSRAVTCCPGAVKCRVMPVGCRNGAVKAPLWNGIRLAAGLSSRMVVECPSV